MKENRVNIPLILSILVAIVLVIVIIFNVTKSNADNPSNDGVNVETTTQFEDTSNSIEETSQQVEEIESTQEIATDDINVVSISDENNNIYVEDNGNANINISIDGSQVVSQDNSIETEPIQQDTNNQDNNANVEIGNVGNGNINIQVN